MKITRNGALALAALIPSVQISSPGSSMLPSPNVGCSIEFAIVQRGDPTPNVRPRPLPTGARLVVVTFYRVETDEPLEGVTQTLLSCDFSADEVF